MFSLGFCTELISEMGNMSLGDFFCLGWVFVCLLVFSGQDFLYEIVLAVLELALIGHTGLEHTELRLPVS